MVNFQLYHSNSTLYITVLVIVIVIVIFQQGAHSVTLIFSGTLQHTHNNKKHITYTVYTGNIRNNMRIQQKMYTRNKLTS